VVAHILHELNRSAIAPDERDQQTRTRTVGLNDDLVPGYRGMQIINGEGVMRYRLDEIGIRCIFTGNIATVFVKPCSRDPKQSFSDWPNQSRHRIGVLRVCQYE
jgi:hypothetical protein